jgi:hypothetical protein
MVIVTEGVPRTTSRVKEVPEPLGELYHHDCYTEHADDPPSAK